MDIAVLNYPTGEVDIIKGIDQDLFEDKYEGEIGLYLKDLGYELYNIYWMSSDEIKVNEIEKENI